MKTGKIVITDKVYFEPDGLKKPDINDYEYGHHSTLRHKQSKSEYLKDFKKHEASKRLIEVDNYCDKPKKTIRIKGMQHRFDNNTPCKAEVNDKATIVELIK